MRIGCLQFAPQVGDVDNNLNRADAVLSRANPDELDLLVLPELAFSGYNFKSLQDITPFLEPSGSGITSLWARTIALKYNCYVTVGYPEKVDVSPKWPTGPEYYNSAIVVNGDGETIANYRKSFLYYTDETWALEGNRGFYDGFLPGLGNTSIGICMDLNPYKFEAPWHAFEFAFHILEVESNLVIVSMAWMTREDPRWFSRMPNEPDMDTLTYWVTRLEPLIRSENEDEIIVVFCNRTGNEDEATYAGTSAVIGIQEGEVKVYGLLGRGEKELLVVDTNDAPYAKLVYRPEGDGTSKHSGSLEKIDRQSYQDESTKGGSSKSKREDDKSNAEGKPRSSEEPAGHPKDQTTRQSPPKDRAARDRPRGRGSSPVPPLPKVPDNHRNEASSKRRKAPPKPISSQPDPAEHAQPGDSPGAESFNIPTPSAPSPTPMAIRPKLIIPESPKTLPFPFPISAASERSERSVQSVRSDESEASVQTVRSNPRPPEDSTPYPHSGAPLSGYPDHSYYFSKRIYGGHVTISGRDEGFSPTTPFDEASPASPRWFWRPSDTLLKTPPPGKTWFTGTPVGKKPEPFPWPAIEEVAKEARTNDTIVQEARIKKTQEGRQIDPQSPQSNASSNKTKFSRSSGGTAKGASKSETKPARPASPKSRNASRSRNDHRSDSAVGLRDMSTAISKHLEGISQRAESMNKMRTELTSPIPDSDRPQSPKSRNCSRTRLTDALNFGIDQQMIQIGASPSILDKGATTTPAHPSPGSGVQQPHLSRLNHHQRSHAFQTANGAPRSLSADRMETAPDGRPASRAASRGRQPGPKISPSNSDPTSYGTFRTPSVDTVAARQFYTHYRGGAASAPRPGRRLSHGTGPQPRRHHSHGREMMEFERFEAIVCPSCPVHGRRRSDPVPGAAASDDMALPGPSPPRTEEHGDSIFPAPLPESQGEINNFTSEPGAQAAVEAAPGKSSRGSNGTQGTGSSERSSSRTISTPGRSPPTPPFFKATTPKAMKFVPDDSEVDPLPGGDISGDDMLPWGSGKEPLRGIELRRSTVAL
ncbi:hypothetical protein Purlil1_9494 [Purpureocillium lilacinum]|uniref:CN hydrolase domain-containing protein n=1 Tax=Purpureocillium lilacinum TaxID=33203 RepID=A0ABR0BQD8_PURLI|nr:hypothetical protein Purlil1_9494 [Purpureocillium lilacinum]